MTKNWILGKKHLTLKNYCGIKGIKYIYHNEWSDPELMITLYGYDFKVNEYEVIDDMWEEYIRDDNGNIIRDQDFEGFSKYLRENVSELKERIINCIKPIAVYTTCNWGGTCILAIEQGIDDYVISAEHYGDGYLRISKSKIQYNLNGDAWFMRRGRREKLSNYIRCDR